MKKLLSILFTLIPFFLFAQEKDSLYQSYVKEVQEIDLQITKIQSAEYELSEKKKELFIRRDEIIKKAKAIEPKK